MTMLQTGFDLTIIDMEHGIIDFETAQNMIFVAKAEGKDTYIRVSDIEESWIVRCLDMGGAGIIFPQITSRQEIERTVWYAKFKP